MNNQRWYIAPSDSDILHYGVLGMKWGVRRYQNEDGSLTAEGRKKYLKGAAISRALGNAVGFLLGGPIAGYLIGKKAQEHQIKSNIEKDEREWEAQKVANMTDKELADFNQRKSLENQLSDILAKENKQTGFNYVKDLLGIVGGSANIIKNVSESAITLSTPTKKQKTESESAIKSKYDANIKSWSEAKKNESEAAIKRLREEAASGKISKSQLNDKIQKINKQTRTDIENYKKSQGEIHKKELRDFNNRTALLMTTKNRASGVSQYTQLTGNTISQLAKAYNSGVNIDTSGLSINDLQKVVNRARMEQQYLNIVTPTNTSNGVKYVSEVVNTAANITGIGAGVISTAKTFKR